jgi:hypothetical protein
MKKVLNTLSLSFLLIALASCSSVRVSADYDKNADFNSPKTFAFFKTGIDKAEINDIDKRRILRAIEAELVSKGFAKSENPDILVSIFTKSSQRVDVYSNPWGFGGFGGFGFYGFSPWGFNQQPAVSTSVEGVLFVDLVNSANKELIWQGKGTGFLTQNVEKKEERIKEFVSKILEQYPPQQRT